MAKSTTFLNNIKKQKNQSGYELSLCQNSRKSVDKQKSYGSLKLLFFQKKKAKKRIKHKLSPLISIILNNIKKQKNNNINDQQYVKFLDV